jgi:hypothetical protein
MDNNRALRVALTLFALLLSPSGVALAAEKPAHAHKPAAAAPQKAATTAAAAPQRLGQIDAWSAFSYKEKNARVCYLVGQPQKVDPAGAKRKAPLAMVTHRPEEKITNVVSFVEGYPLKEGSDVLLEIGGSRFELFTKDDSAWARTAELDRSIVTTLSKAKLATVKGSPQKGGSGTTDTYSLAGFAQALALIDKACGVKR